MKPVPSHENLPLVYVVIPNKNGAFHLAYSLPSLRSTAYPNFNVVMVDNLSTDNSLEFAKINYPGIEILVNKSDVGFAGSVNNGIRHALKSGADYVAVFSNDIKVLPDWLGFSLNVYGKNAKAGIVGFMEISREVEHLFVDNGVNPDAVKSGTELPGCLFVCSMKTFIKTGLMDEGYFMYGEDNDFFERVTKAGFEILQTEMPVWHYGEGASINRRLVPAWLAYRNALRFAVKNQGIFNTVHMAGALLYHGCLAPRNSLKSNPSINRLKRYGRTVNLFLFLASCAWNLFFLPRTLWCRVYLPGPRCEA